MSINKIQLKTSSILSVPLQNFSDDFTFIVNDEEFKTSRLISDLLSPIICKIHTNDPTLDRFSIKTQHKGDFSHILNLTNFKEIEISEKESDFFSEVLGILGNESIEFLEENSIPEITVDNVLPLIKNHDKFSKLHSKNLLKEIEFISEHFFEICEKSREDLKSLSIDTLFQILNHQKLQLNTEDQLIQFVNELYIENPTFSILYETVYFVNVSSSKMKEFISIYDEEKMSKMIWMKLCDRLESEIKMNQILNKERYKVEQKVGKTFKVTNENTFSGIASYLKQNSSNKIEDIINITFSSNNNEGSTYYHPSTMFLYDEKDKHFVTKNIEGSWICFEFKNHQVIPTDYQLRSANSSSNWYHPKSWVVEGSNDKNSWEILDEQTNCSYLNGSNLSHTFKIEKEKSKEYKFIKIRSTGKNWGNTNHLIIESFEIYGTLI